MEKILSCIIQSFQNESSTLSVPPIRFQITSRLMNGHTKNKSSSPQRLLRLKHTGDLKQNSYIRTIAKDAGNIIDFTVALQQVPDSS